MVGKANQHATLDSIVRDRLLTGVQTLGCSDSQESLEQWPDLTRCLRVNAHSAATLDFVPIALGVAPGAHQHKKIRLRLVANEIIPWVIYFFCSSAHEQVPPLSQGGDQRHRPHTSIILCGQQHSRIAWVRRKREHTSSECCDVARSIINSAEIREQRLGA